MTCEQIEDQLFERTTGDWADLAGHLEACAQCRALADDISVEEAGFHRQIDAYVNATDFDRQWEQASARRPRSIVRWGWLQAAAVMLAATGVLALASQSGPDRSGTATNPSAGTESAHDHIVQIRQDTSAFLTLSGPAKTIYLVDPEVADINIAKDNAPLQIRGLTVGKTAIHVVYRDGFESLLELEVVPPHVQPRPSPDPDVRTHPDTVLTLDQGEVEHFECDHMHIVGVTNPDQLDVQSEGVHRIAVTALEPGLAEMWLLCDGSSMPEVIHIDIH